MISLDLNEHRSINDKILDFRDELMDYHYERYPDTLLDEFGCILTDHLKEVASFSFQEGTTIYFDSEKDKTYFLLKWS